MPKSVFAMKPKTTNKTITPATNAALYFTRENTVEKSEWKPRDG